MTQGTDTRFSNRDVYIKGYGPADAFTVRSALILERMSTLTEITIEIMSGDIELDMKDLLNKKLTLCVDIEEDEPRRFHGMCVSVRYLGVSQGEAVYSLELRPWMWKLTRVRNLRIFQNMSAIDIINQVLRDRGLPIERLRNTTTAANIPKREYCVQYQETDYHFLKRLMEEEGIFYFFDQTGEDEEVLILSDNSTAGSAHATIDQSPVRYYDVDTRFRGMRPHIFEFQSTDQLTPNVVTLTDYDFENPSYDPNSMNEKNHGEVLRSAAEGAQIGDEGQLELYGFPSNHTDKSRGKSLATIELDAELAERSIHAGSCNVRSMEVGKKFELEKFRREKDNREYLVLETKYEIRGELYYKDDADQSGLEGFQQAQSEEDRFLCSFKAIPSDVTYREKKTTPWPRLAGPQTAIVVGPAGDEIHTDEHGRIKVQFPWDREGKQDDKSTCYVRVSMPWSGNAWGMFGIPRIGQEVVIQFESGDPDRPICTGMVYNGVTPQPTGFPANKTQTGIVTRSSKNGTPDTFHELVFEDKINEELVRFQSERDYKATIKNNADITIGMEHQDEGSKTETVYKDKSEFVKTGDHLHKVEEGNQTLFVKIDKTEDIEGKSTQTITGDTTQTVLEGDRTTNVNEGDDTHIVDRGDIYQEAGLGNIHLKAMQSIKLECGNSTIKLTPTEITISSVMIIVEGDATVDVTSALTTVNADGLLTLNGSLTMIN